MLALCFVHPEHRRRGAGTLLIDWGFKKADELGIEAFVEAVDDGVPLYERCGYHYMNTTYMHSTVDHPSPQWQQLEQELRTPIHFHLMWRPVGGKYKSGKTVVPWKGRPTVDEERPACLRDY